MGHRSKSRHQKSRTRRSSRRHHDHDYDPRQGYIYGGSEPETSYLQQQQSQQLQQQQQQLQQYEGNYTCEYASQIQYHQYPPFPLYAGETCPMCFTVLDQDKMGPCIQQYCTIPYQVPKPPPSNFFEKNPCGRNPFERPITPAAPAPQVYCCPCPFCTPNDYYNNAEQQQDPQQQQPLQFGFQGYYSQEQPPYPAFVVYDQDHAKDNAGADMSQKNPAILPAQTSQQGAAGIPSNSNPQTSDGYHKMVDQMMEEAVCQCKNCTCTIDAHTYVHNQENSQDPPPGSQQVEGACACQNCTCTIDEKNEGPPPGSQPSVVSKSIQNAEKSRIVQDSNDQNGSLKFDPNLESNLQGADNGSLAEKPGESLENPKGPSAEDFIDGDEEDKSVGSSNISFPSLSSTSSIQGDDKSTKKSKK